MVSSYPCLEQSPLCCGLRDLWGRLGLFSWSWPLLPLHPLLALQAGPAPATPSHSAPHFGPALPQPCLDILGVTLALSPAVGAELHEAGTVRPSALLPSSLRERGRAQGSAWRRAGGGVLSRTSSSSLLSLSRPRSGDTAHRVELGAPQHGLEIWLPPPFSPTPGLGKPPSSHHSDGAVLGQGLASSVQ